MLISFYVAPQHGSLYIVAMPQNNIFRAHYLDQLAHNITGHIVQNSLLSYFLLVEQATCNSNIKRHLTAYSRMLFVFYVE